MRPSFETYWRWLSELVRDGQVTGPQAHGRRIAALCLQDSVEELWSADRGFGRLPEPDVSNPLIP